VFEENKTPQTVNPESWSSVQNGIVTEHPFANINENKPQSVAAIVPGAPGAPIPGKKTVPKSGGGGISAVSTLNNGLIDLSGVTIIAPKTLSDLKGFITAVANQNNTFYCVEDIMSHKPVPPALF
jgi:hypothetical protein